MKPKNALVILLFATAISLIGWLVNIKRKYIDGTIYRQ